MHKFIFSVMLTATIFAGQIFALVIRIPQDYPTIQQGIDAANAGDVVLVAPGTYPEEITMKAGVVITGAGEDLSVIDGGGDAGDVVSAIGNDITSTAKLQGFTITGASNSGGMPGGAGVFCNSGAAPEVSNNRVEGNDQGIVMWNQSSAFLHNNVVIDNVYTGIGISSAAIIVNNTVANNSTGMYDSGGYRPTIMNNIVTGNSSRGIGCINNSVPTDLSYNDVWGNGQNYYNCSAGPGSISEDPLYVDEPGGDFHLQGSSPCIDSGNPLPQYNDPDGSRNDMGAYGGPGAAVNFPLVTLTIPAQNQLNVAYDIDASAFFNIDMDSSTFTSSSCIFHGHQTGIHTGTVTYDSAVRMVNIVPNQNFKCGEFLTVVLTREILSVAGDSLKGFVWQFITEVDSGSGLFSSPASYASGANPYPVITGDFNSDGNLDLTTANANSDNVSVLMGNGDGTFNTAVNYGVGATPYGLISNDFNEDGNLDLATANRSSDNVSVLLGNGDGTFGTASNYPAGMQPNALCSGDFNADGNFDLVATNSGSQAVSILTGNGDGSFNMPTGFSVGNTPYAVCTGDFNGDGNCDLAAANYGSNNISILLGDGLGSFDPANNYSVSSNPTSICVSDFNEDGDFDLAVANSGSNSVSRLLGNGDGSFGPPANYAVGNTPYSIGTSDVDGDGSFDLAVSNSVSNTISILVGNGNGTFNSAVSYSAGSDPRGIVAGDFDNDFDIDLSTANASVDSVSILLNEAALRIVATDPSQNQLDVLKSTDVSATFSIDVDSATVNDSTFLVLGAQSGRHSGGLVYNSGTLTATLDPSLDFIDGEEVSVILTKEIQSMIGVYLRGFVWNYTAEITTPSDGTFQNPLNFPTGSQPRGMYVGDFDADTDIDIAVTSNQGVISVLLNNGDGTFQAPVNYAVSQEPIAVFGTDLDEDNDIDLAVVNNRPGSANLDILKNAGNGTFTRTATYTLSIMGNSLYGSDFDTDGDIDLVLSSYWGSNNNVDIMFNNGDGTFIGPYIYSAGTWAHGVTAKDVDNDGDIDLAVASSGNDNVSILLNDGDGDFSDLANYAVGDYPNSVYGNDFNGDGYVDLATANSSGDDITVILNNGDGTYASPTSYATGNNTRYLHGGDFDGDGDIDLAASINGADTVAVILNNGNGTFDSLSTYQVLNSPWGIQAADYDLDGDLDIACCNYNSNNVTVLYNSGVGIEESRQYGITTFLRIYPNPSRNQVNIRYCIGWDAKYIPTSGTLKIYDASGRLVRSFSLSTSKLSSPASISWNGADEMGKKVSNGVYFCQLRTADFTITRQIVLIR